LAGEGHPPTNHGSIDLDAALRSGNLTLSIDPTENQEDAKYRRLREFILFVVAITIVVVALVLSTLFLYESSTSAEDKKWVQSLLTLIIGSFMGYLVGKKSK